MRVSEIREPDFGRIARVGARLSYSQFGEDLIAFHFLGRKKNGFYVDVGCHDPFRYSNTALFHTYRGWHGINIDADPAAIERFKKARPNDINLNVGVSDSRGELEFSIFAGDPAQNTFDQGMAARAARKLQVKEVVRVPVVSLAAILHQHCPTAQEIDYLNIDCEGLDDKVVLGNDWSAFRPKVISIEIHNFDLSNPKANRVFNDLSEAGYKMVAHCIVTSFFLREA